MTYDFLPLHASVLVPCLHLQLTETQRLGEVYSVENTIQSIHTSSNHLYALTKKTTSWALPGWANNWILSVVSNNYVTFYSSQHLIIEGHCWVLTATGIRAATEHYELMSCWVVSFYLCVCGTVSLATWWEFTFYSKKNRTLNIIKYRFLFHKIYNINILKHYIK